MKTHLRGLASKLTVTLEITYFVLQKKDTLDCNKNKTSSQNQFDSESHHMDTTVFFLLDIPMEIHMFLA